MTKSGAADLLVEIGCEELPPLSLQRLAESFYEGCGKRLEAAGFAHEAEASRVFYTPRRLAFRIAQVAARQVDQVQDRKGPAVEAAFDAEGKPTAAATGFARSVGREVEALERHATDKGEWLFCRVEQPGQTLDELIFPILEQALADLPITRPMRWSGHAFSFVRPVHWLVVLHGSRVIQGSLFGQAAGNTTHGHRVHSPGPHPIAAAERYEAVLEAASVLVDPELRKSRVREAVTAAAVERGGQARITDALLDEVCNIVEWPVAVACSFEPAFLDVPQEALIASMEDHQKFFPVLDPKSQALAPHFVAVANLESQDPEMVRDGFERVIRPRLADARFFWEQDRRQPLQDYAERLAGVLFQPKLGTIGDKTKRIEAFSRIIAEIIDIDPEPVARAALLCKCDLVTQMVGEFPGLQGIMGGHYASASGEPDAVALAIREHYSPRYAGDVTPATDAGRVLALADRLDTLVGIFASGAKPSGNKDPFALRRAALGAARIMLEAPLPIGLDDLFNAAARCLEPRLAVSGGCLSEARHFLLERVRQHFLESGYRTGQVNAALAAPLSTLPDLAARLSALSAFMALPEAEQLVAANKRIGNILSASESPISGEINEDSLFLDEERRLFDQVVELELQLEPRFNAGDYDQALAALAGLDRLIAPFFDQVMVMDEDLAIRNNRLALLFRLKSLFDRIADLSVVG